MTFGLRLRNFESSEYKRLNLEDLVLIICIIGILYVVLGYWIVTYYRGPNKYNLENNKNS